VTHNPDSSKLIVGDAVDAAIESDMLNGVYAYWKSLLRDGGLPSRVDIEPWKIPNYLPFVNLVDVYWVDETTRRYRHRLLGTELVERFRESTDEWFDEVYTAEHLAVQLQAYDLAATTHEANLDTVIVVTQGATGMFETVYRRLMMPLASDGEQVDVLFLVFEFEQYDPDFHGRLSLHRPFMQRNEAR
jgi:hypothetical protein